VVAPASAPQLLPQQQSVPLPPVVAPDGPRAPVIDRWTQRQVVRDIWPLVPIDDDSALTPDAFMPKEKARVVRRPPRRCAQEARAPAPVVKPPAIEIFCDPSSKAVAEFLREKERRVLEREQRFLEMDRRRLERDRRRLEEERRRSLYDAVFGAAAAVVVAAGLGLVAGLWAW
jgi:hypothetical protein